MISKGTRSPHFSKRHHCLCSQLSDYIYNQTKRNFSEQLTGLENQLEPHFFPYRLINDARTVRERKRAEKEKESRKREIEAGKRTNRQSM